MDISVLSTRSLTELFYLADKYDVIDMKEAVIDTLGDNWTPEDDDVLAVEAAYLGYNAIFPDLSEALYKRSVKIIQCTYGSSDAEEVRLMFDQFR